MVPDNKALLPIELGLQINQTMFFYGCYSLFMQGILLKVNKYAANMPTVTTPSPRRCFSIGCVTFQTRRATEEGDRTAKFTEPLCA